MWVKVGPEALPLSVEVYSLRFDREVKWSVDINNCSVLYKPVDMVLCSVFAVRHFKYTSHAEQGFLCIPVCYNLFEGRKRQTVRYNQLLSWDCWTRVLLLSLWHVKDLRGCALVLSCGHSSHPGCLTITWSWLSFPQPSAKETSAPLSPRIHVPKGSWAGSTWLCARSPISPPGHHPWSCPNPVVAAARGCWCLAEVPPQSHGESELVNWMKRA